MKLTMRVKEFSKKITLMSTAFVLAVSTLATALPFISSENASAVSTIHSTDLAGWSFAEQRTRGHSVLVADGLHVWTESNDSQSKAAGYYNTPGVVLADISQTSIDYSGTPTGILPSTQLVVDFDANGTPDGILVGEAVYGANHWLSNGSMQFAKDSAPHTGTGNGSDWYGTLDEWSSAFSSAKVMSIGYSLGSGVQGDSVISKITIGDIAYTFGLPVNEAPTVPSLTFPDDSVARKTSNTNQSKWSISTDPEGDAVSYVYQSASDAAFTHILYDSRVNGSGPQTSNFIANPGEPEGVYYWHVKAVDSHGTESDWSTPRSIVVDNTAPTISHISPVAGSAIGNTASFEFTATDTLSGVRNVNLHLMQNNDTKKIVALQQDGTSDRWFATGVSMNIPAGEYTIVSRATDKAGNTQFVNSNHGKITLDKNRPTVTLTSPTKSLLNGKLNVQVDATDTIRGLQSITANIYKDNILVKSSSSTVSGPAATHNAEFTLGDGTYEIRYNARNALGNISSTGNFTVTVDNTAPIASISVDPLKNGQYITKTVTITGSVDSSELSMKSHWFEITGPSYSHSIATGLNKGGNSYSVAWNTAGLASGTYNIRYVATDAAGNRSDDPNYQNSTVLQVIVDNQGPQANFTSTVPTHVNSNFTVAGVGSDNIGLKGIFFDIRDASGYVAGCVAGTNALAYTNSDKNATLSCEMNTANLVDGKTYTLRIHAGDNAGYGGGESRQIVFDETAPVVKNLKITQNSSDISGGSTKNPLITVKWESDDTDIDYFMYKNKGGWHNVGLSKSFTGNMSGADGVFTYQVYAVDHAGNVSETQTASVTLDRVAPAAAPVMRVSTGGVVLSSGDAINQNDIRAEWDAVIDATVYQYRYWNDISGDTYEGQSNAWVKPSSSALFHAGTFTQGQGTHFLQVRAGDDAGNWSDWSSAFEVMYDTTNISASIDTYARTGNTITPNVDTNGETPVSQSWTQISGPVDGVTISNPAVLKPIFTVLQDGDYVFQLKTVDAAGNESLSLFSFTYEAPVVALTAGIPGQPDTPTITGPFTNVLGDSTAIPEAAVEGASDEKGASDILAQAVDADNTDGEALGLAWYWWLLIVAAAAALVWWIVAMIRGRNAQA